MELKRIGIEQKEAIKKLFVSVFTIEPWNDDWSDEKQLDCYIDELCIRTDRQGAGAGNFFLSEIEKAIKELGLKQIFLQTEAHVPAYEFYKKNGYIELEGHVSFAKEL